VAGIDYVDYFLPDLVSLEECISTYPKNWMENYKDVHDFLQMVRTDRYGFDKISVGNPETNLQIVSNLMGTFLSSTGVNPNTISYIISTDYWATYINGGIDIIQFLQTAFQLKTTSIFSIQQQCGASCFAIGLAARLAVQNRDDNIVILSNNTAPRESRFGPGYIMGDGASIIAVNSTSKDYEIIDFASISSGYGSYTEYHKKTQFYYKDKFTEESKKFYSNIHFRAVKLIKMFLKQNGLKPDDLEMIIVQPVNRVTYVELYAKPLGIPESKIYLQNISLGGHLGNVDMARNFKDFIDNQTPPKGSYILFYASAFNGVGDITNNLVLVRHT
jgi:3-oxoacyl-[acyl-carrier-protein] synthase III